jgi:N-acetylmuramoyl-L-alanine amidase
LSDRAKFANDRGADFFISIHNNAADSSAHGFESFIYTYAGSTTAKYQSVIHAHIMSYLNQYNIRDRGQKKANFAVLRETVMPAILLENLFITNERENQLLQDDAFLDGLAEAIVSGVADIFGLQKKKPKPMYRITVDGQFVVDTAYPAILKDKLEKAVLAEKKEIVVKIRD